MIKLPFWCQKILPLVYDGALSYYEVISKVVSKLNELIEWSNGVDSTVTAASQVANDAAATATEADGKADRALAAAENIPTKTSDLTNDSGFVNSAGAASAAPVQSVNSETGNVIILVPTKTSDLTNDSGFVNSAGAASAAPVQSVNGQTGNVVISGGGGVSSVNGQTGDVVIAIPAKTSDLQNDSGFIEADEVIVHPSFSSSDNTTALRTFAYNHQGVFYSWHLYGASSYSPTNDGNAYWQFTLYAQDTPSINYFILTAIDLNNGAYYICDKYDAWHEVAMVANIPTKTSDLSNDSGFVNASGAASAAPVQSVNGNTGAVVLAIPTKTSDLVNDSGFVTSSHSHSASDITSGVLSTSVGGTGVAGGLKGDSGVLYGTTEPANPATGQVFFKVTT